MDLVTFPSDDEASSLGGPGGVSADDEGGDIGEVGGAGCVGLVGAGSIVCAAGDDEEGRVFSIGWSAPRLGKGSSSSSTIPTGTGIAPVVVLRTGIGSKTVFPVSLESRLYECLLCECEFNVGRVRVELVGGDCSIADRGLLIGDVVTLVAVAAAISSSASPCWCLLELEWDVVLLPFCCFAFFLVAAALTLFRSRVPSPSALHRACSRTSSCSWSR